MSKYIENLKDTFNPHIDNADALSRRLTSLLQEATDAIRDTLNKLPNKSFEIQDYDPDCLIKLDGGKTIRVKSIFLDGENEVCVLDDEGWNYWELDHEWNDWSVLLFQVLTTCIARKIHDYEEMKVGSIVRWNDPGIDDYDEEDREEIENLNWVIDKIPEDFEDDSVICISNEYSEAEVLPWELVLVKP